MFPSFRVICKKMCSFYVTSSGMVAFFHAVTIGNLEESKNIWRHNRILTNEELTSNEPHGFFWVKIGINWRRIRGNSLTIYNKDLGSSALMSLVYDLEIELKVIDKLDFLDFDLCFYDMIKTWDFLYYHSKLEIQSEVTLCKTWSSYFVHI